MTSIGTSSFDEDLVQRVQARIDEIEVQLARTATSSVPMLNDAAHHLLAAGGKRFRPLLVVLAAELGSRPDDPGVIIAAQALELTHVATLYHDDVMDEAPQRRGAPSANLRWGNSIAILTGDFLLARASELVSFLGEECVRIQARTFARLVEGQIQETAGPADGDDPLEHHLRVLADKTGSLIATSAQIGAIVGGCTPEVTEALRAFGEYIGVAFQLADDVLDVVGEAADSGKTPGTDLREGVLTLPTFYVLRSTDPADAELRGLIGRPLDDTECARALALLRPHVAVEAARREAQQWADRAARALDPVPDHPAKDALLALCSTVVDRTA